MSLSTEKKIQAAADQAATSPEALVRAAVEIAIERDHAQERAANWRTTAAVLAIALVTSIIQMFVYQHRYEKDMMFLLRSCNEHSIQHPAAR